MSTTKSHDLSLQPHVDPPVRCAQRETRSASASRWLLIGLSLTVLLGGYPRFSGIRDVGIRYDDESWYTSDALLWHRCASVLLDAQAWAAVSRGDKAAFRERLAHHGVDFSHRYLKPCQGYTFLGALAMFAAGEGPDALLLANALLGTTAIIVVYAVGAVMYSPIIGLCAAFALAVSPYHLVYCRTALADTSMGLFLLLAVLFWSLGVRGWWPWRRAYVCCGIGLGMAITCHYRAGYFPVVLVLGDLLLTRRFRTELAAAGAALPGFMRRAVWLVAGTLLPVLALESVFRLARLAAWATDSFLPVPTFLEAGWNYWLIMRERIGVTGGSWINLAGAAAYVEYLLYWQGWVFALVMTYGLAAVLAQDRPAKWPALFVLATAAVLVTQRYTVSRGLSPAIPFFCICFAVGLRSLASVMGMAGRSASMAAVFATVFASEPPLTHAWNLVGKTSDIQAACRILEWRRADTVALPMDERKYSLYLDKAGINGFSLDTFSKYADPQEVIRRLRERGTHWVLTDPQHWHCHDPGQPWDQVFQWWQKMEAALKAEAILVAEFDHLSDYRREFLSEGWGVHHVPEMRVRGDGPLRIYYLEPLSSEHAFDSTGRAALFCKARLYDAGKGSSHEVNATSNQVTHHGN